MSFKSGPVRPGPVVLCALLLGAVGCGGQQGPYIQSSWERKLSTAQTALEQKRYGDAEKIYRELLRSPGKLQDDPMLMGQTLNNFASALKGEDKLDQAEPLYRRALSIIEKAPGSSSNDFSVVADNYVSLLETAGRPDDAQRVREREKDYFKARPAGSIEAGQGGAKDGTAEQAAKPRDGGPSRGPAPLAGGR